MSLPIPPNLENFLTPEMRLGAAIIVVWLVCAGLSGWIAGRRNRDDGLWAVGGLFLGPIALIAILLMPKQTKERPLTPLWAELEKREREEHRAEAERRARLGQSGQSGQLPRA